MAISEKVFALRQSKNWTLAHVSELTGISLSHLSAIENGTRKNPSFSVIAKIARVYGAPLSYFDDTGPIEESVIMDNPTQAFLASEQASTYISFAKRLAEGTPYVDTSTLLKLIAEFLSDQKERYNGNRHG